MRSLVWLLLCLGAIVELPAQGPERPEAPRPICFRGRPLPYCANFWVLETELTGRVAGNRWERESLGQRRPEKIGGWYSLALGRMRNRDSTTAVGATADLGYDSDGNVRFAAKVRRRAWNSDETSSDLEIGLLQLGHATASPFAPGTAFGITAGGAANFFDRAALTGHIDVAIRGGKTRAAIVAGGRLGSRTAIIGNAIFVGTVVALVALIGANGGYSEY